MNILKKITTITALLLLQLSFLMAQGPGDPPPPPPGGGHGSNTNEEPGGGAPIGNGLVILSILAAGYGAKKLYDHKKKKLLD